MKENNFRNYESGTILEITLDRGNGEIKLPYIRQGVDKDGKQNLRHYDIETGKIGNRLDTNLTKIIDIQPFKKQDK